MVIVLLWFLAMKNVAIAGLGVTYIRSTGEHAPATIVGPSTRLERVSIPYPLMGSKDTRTMLNFAAARPDAIALPDNDGASVSTSGLNMLYPQNGPCPCKAIRSQSSGS
uniref:Uncharacterized protein n=1 Tax=Eutreptiella gymnastica TaxID=73025 RepID=A0A7S4LEI4_9EUGL